jgi:hypothetical protein
MKRTELLSPIGVERGLRYILMASLLFFEGRWNIIADWDDTIELLLSGKGFIHFTRFIRFHLWSNF